MQEAHDHQYLGRSYVKEPAAGCTFFVIFPIDKGLGQPAHYMAQRKGTYPFHNKEQQIR